MGWGDHWNTRPEDLDGPWPCDDFAPAGAARLYRAIDIAAPLENTWPWICQLRVAPYSYDWIDNRGRRSPQERTPALERLEVGQTVMSIFRIVGFEPGKHLTIEARGMAGLGPIHVSYRTTPASHGTRLTAQLRVAYPQSLPGSGLLRALAVGDWIMMRKQLLTLKRYAEAEPVPASTFKSSDRDAVNQGADGES